MQPPGDEAKEAKSVVNIQSLCRAMLAQRRFSESRNAAISIQATARGKLVRTEIELASFAATIIQRQWRAFSSCSNYQQSQTATRVIQAAMRGKLVRLELEMAHLAATMVQASFRGYTCRSQYLNRQWPQRSNETTAATKIQSAWRMKSVRMEVEMASFTATIIQAWYRRYNCKCQFKLLKDRALSEAAAATAIQSAWRMKLAQLMVELERFAATVLAARWRAYSARSRYLQSQKAAVRIQKSVRGFFVRTEIGLAFLAATFIQSLCRRFLCRSRFLTELQHEKDRAAAIRREEDAAAVRIQSAWRGRAARCEVEVAHLAAAMIQAHWRGAAQQWKYELTRLASVVIESWYRRWVAQKEYRMIRKARSRSETASRSLNKPSDHSGSPSLEQKKDTCLWDEEDQNSAGPVGHPALAPEAADGKDDTSSSSGLSSEPGGYLYLRGTGEEDENDQSEYDSRAAFSDSEVALGHDASSGGFSSSGFGSSSSEDDMLHYYRKAALEQADNTPAAAVADTGDEVAAAAATPDTVKSYRSWEDQQQQEELKVHAREEDEGGTAAGSGDATSVPYDENDRDGETGRGGGDDPAATATVGALFTVPLGLYFEKTAASPVVSWFVSDDLSHRYEVQSGSSLVAPHAVTVRSSAPSKEEEGRGDDSGSEEEEEAPGEAAPTTISPPPTPSTKEWLDAAFFGVPPPRAARRAAGDESPVAKRNRAPVGSWFG